MNQHNGSGSPVDDFSKSVMNKFFTDMSPSKMANTEQISSVVEKSSVSVQGTQTGEEIPSFITDKAKQLAFLIVFYFKSENNNNSKDKCFRTMKRTARELSEKHDILFTSMVNKLKLNEHLNIDSFKVTFVAVLDEMFSDGKINWGRVVAVYAFGGRLAKYIQEHHYNYHQELADALGQYVAQKLGPWIQKNGGWDSFVDYFPEENALEERLWRGLLYTAVGLGTVAAFVAVR